MPRYPNKCYDWSTYTTTERGKEKIVTYRLLNPEKAKEYDEERLRKRQERLQQAVQTVQTVQQAAQIVELEEEIHDIEQEIETIENNNNNTAPLYEQDDDLTIIDKEEMKKLENKKKRKEKALTKKRKRMSKKKRMEAGDRLWKYWYNEWSDEEEDDHDSDEIQEIMEEWKRESKRKRKAEEEIGPEPIRKSQKQIQEEKDAILARQLANRYPKRSSRKPSVVVVSSSEEEEEKKEEDEDDDDNDGFENNNNLPVADSIYSEKKRKEEEEERRRRSNYFITVVTPASLNQYTELELEEIAEKLQQRINMELLYNAPDYITFIDPKSKGFASVELIEITTKPELQEMRGDAGQLHTHTLYMITHRTRVQLNYPKIKKLIDDIAREMKLPLTSGSGIANFQAHIQRASHGGASEKEYLDENGDIWEPEEVAEYYDRIDEYIRSGLVDKESIKRFRVKKKKKEEALQEAEEQIRRLRGQRFGF